MIDLWTLMYLLSVYASIIFFYNVVYSRAAGVFIVGYVYGNACVV